MFKLTIDTDNAAFDEDPAPEVARILRKIAADLESGIDASHHLTIRDVNGNDVGRYVLLTGVYEEYARDNS